MLNTTALSLSWFTQISHRPDGSMLKFRATCPSVSACPASLIRPLASSMRKIAMSSHGPPEPRFEAYTNRPDGCTTTCADHFLPPHPSGSVDSFWISSNVPLDGPQRSAVSYDDRSLTTSAYRLLGWNAMWRGPRPRAYWMNGGSFGTSLPLPVSRLYTYVR